MLTFDVEEFDIPLEYNLQIEKKEQLEIGRKGLEAITSILDDEALACTLFTTANFATYYPEAINRLAKKHEIASHTYYHSSFETSHLASSKKVLEEISGVEVTGLRMPRLRPVEMKDVLEAGYEYDSSINPTLIPGRYNNTHLPRLLYTDEGVLRLPASVTPNFRIPLFWLAFKNMPYLLYKRLAIQSLKKDGCLSLYFHPWEFTDLSKFELPGYVKRWSGEILLNRLKKLIDDLRPYGDFVTIRSFITWSKNNNSTS